MLFVELCDLCENGGPFDNCCWYERELIIPAIRSKPFKFTSKMVLKKQNAPNEDDLVTMHVRTGNKRLTTEDVYQILTSSQKPAQKIESIVPNLCNLELKWFIRMINKNLNLGLGRKAIVQSQYITPGTPFYPVLAKSKFAKLDYPIIIEPKYDGERIMIHKTGGDVQIFSRNKKLCLKAGDLPNCLNDFPDELILDGELLFYKNVEDSLPAPFGSLGVIKQLQGGVVKAAIFDILFYNRSLIYLPLQDRKMILSELPWNDRIFNVAWEILSFDSAKLKAQEFLKQKYEGAVLKNPLQEYKCGDRLWFKLKKEQLGLELPTFDLLCYGGSYGTGKNYNKISSLSTVLGNEHFCKASNLSESDIEYFTSLKGERSSDGSEILFDQPFTIEVQCGEIVKSDNSFGYSLRFPRFVRMRPDINPDLGDTLSKLAAFYSS